MYIQPIPGDGLTLDQISAWSALQPVNPLWQSPFMGPEFTMAAAQSFKGVEVAVLEEDGDPVGFFPFQRVGRSVGRAVAWRISELHGPVIGKDVAWCTPHLLRECGLKAFHFEFAPISENFPGAYHLSSSISASIDLGRGFEAYCSEKRRDGTSLISQTLRKTRKIEREQGQIRFELNTGDPAAFQALIEWKSQQFKRLGSLDLFKLSGMMDFLERIRLAGSSGLSGLMSALYLNDRVIAVQLGMRSRTVLTCLLPAFDRTYAPYSPGSIFLLKLIRAAAAEGIERIDLGPGSERFKVSLKSMVFRLAEGSWDTRPVSRTFHTAWIRTRERAESSPLMAAPLRTFRNLRNQGIQRLERLSRHPGTILRSDMKKTSEWRQ